MNQLPADVIPVYPDSPPGSPFPNYGQKLLLKAAILSGQAALNAWNEWKGENDIMDYLDYGSFRVLPLLYRNLLNLHSKDDAMPRIKGVYLHTWSKNHKLVYEAAKVLLLFKEHQIPTLVLKGVALSLLYYKDMGIRPMSDVDILIPYNEAARAMSLLKDAGWIPGQEDHIDFNLRYGKSMDFHGEAGFELDLHWHPFFESLSLEDDEDFWEKAIPLKVGGVQTLALCPEDAFLHVIIHGLRWNPDPPIRWIPDALTILQVADQAFDWARLLQQISRMRLAIQFKEAMAYLQEHFHLEVPPFVIMEMARMRIGFAEKFVYKNNIREDAETLPDSFFPRLRYLFSVYLRQTKHDGLALQLMGYIKFLLFRVKGKSPFKVFWYYLTKKKETKL